MLTLKSAEFSKATAYVGFATYGLDILQSFGGIFSSTLSVAIMTVAGTLYLVLFPSLARDFFRPAKNNQAE